MGHFYDEYRGAIYANGNHSKAQRVATNESATKEYAKGNNISNVPIYTEAYLTNTSELWPVHLTTSQLPNGGGECLTATAVQNESCLVGGYQTIAETMPNFDAIHLGAYNITFFNDDVSRNLVYSPETNSTWVALLVGQVLARSLGLLNQWVYVPWKLSIANQNGRDLLKPLAQVQENDDRPVHEISLGLSRLDSLVTPFCHGDTLRYSRPNEASIEHH